MADIDITTDEPLLNTEEMIGDMINEICRLTDGLEQESGGHLACYVDASSADSGCGGKILAAGIVCLPFLCYTEVIKIGIDEKCRIKVFPDIHLMDLIYVRSDPMS